MECLWEKGSGEGVMRRVRERVEGMRGEGEEEVGMIGEGGDAGGAAFTLLSNKC